MYTYREEGREGGKEDRNFEHIFFTQGAHHEAEMPKECRKENKK